MKKTSREKITIVGMMILLLIVVSGFFATIYMTKKIEADERSSLLLRAHMVATMLDTDKLSSLKGQESDLTKPEYTYIKSSLERVRDLNTDSRFVYIIGQRESKQFFYVDAEDASSPDSSPPGQSYDEATSEDIANIKSETAFTKGPYTDRWGTWFTAYAPIIGSDGVLRAVGVDIEADRLLLRISIVRQATIIIFSLIFLSALSVLLLLRNTWPTTKN